MYYIESEKKKPSEEGWAVTAFAPLDLHNVCEIRTPFFSSARGGGERKGGGGLDYFYSASGFYKYICRRPPHFLSASYAPAYMTITRK